MLELKNIVKIYRPKKGVPVKALDGVSLNIQSKGMVFLLGKSGSGKSTMLNVIGGLDKYDKGEIIVKGKSTLNFSQSDFDSYRNTYVGFVFQEYNILEDFSVGANIGLALELQGKKATDEAINHILKQVDLEGYGHRKPNELSGGQKQRVAIARALVKEPDIILADEPSGALDSVTGIQVFDTLKRLSRDKLVIVVSHDREFAEKYGDRIIELADGKVINDVERVTVAGTTTNQGMAIVDHNIIQIKKGYRLTEEDRMKINEYLEKLEKDLHFTNEPVTNLHIQNMTETNDSVYQNTFQPTDQEKLKGTLQHDDTFAMIKSRFPYKNALRMGSSGLKIKPIRLIFTILLSVVSFTLFGLVDTLNSYDKVTNTVQSIKDTNINYLSISKLLKVPSEWDKRGYNLEVGGSLTQHQIEELEELLDISFKGVVRTKDNHLGYSLQNYSYNFFYQATYSGFIEMSQDELKDYGFTLTGRMPENKQEIAITQHIYEHYKEYGFYTVDQGPIKGSQVNSVESFLGYKPLFYYQDVPYTITGVVDTKFDSNRFERLKTMTNESMNYRDYLLMSEMEVLTNYGYHTMIFTGPGMIDEILSRHQGLIQLDFDDLRVHESEDEWGSEIHFLQYEPTDQHQKLYFTDQETLNKHDVLINIADLIEFNYDQLTLRYLLLEQLQDVPVKNKDIPLGETRELYTFERYINDQFHAALREYVEENFESFCSSEHYNCNLPEDMRLGLVDEFVYLLKHVHYYENTLFSGKSGITILSETLFKIINEYELTNRLVEYFDSFLFKGWGLHRMNIPFDEIKVVGLFMPTSSFYSTAEDWTRGPFSLLTVSEEFYNLINDIRGGEYAFAITQMPSNRKHITRIVKTIDGLNISDYYTYGIQNEISQIAEEITLGIEQMAIVFLYLGIAFCIFASLMLLNFIATSISYKKREIGILRAIGARSKDVFRIFFSESLIIALINFILAVIATMIIVHFINNTMREEYQLMFTILRFGFRQFFFILFVSVFAAFIGSFFPVYKTARKKPIEAIRNS